MYRNRRIFLLLICAIIPCFTAYKAAAQNYVYEIRYANSPVGTLEVKQEVSGAHRRIFISSRVQMKLFSRMDTDIKTEYLHNVLEKARAVRLGGKSAENKETVTERAQKGYVVIRKGEEATLKQTQISYCVGDLYFSEPKDIREVYSETLGQFLPIKQLEDKRYELSMPDGKRNMYRYEKGRLTDVEVNHQLGKAYFRLIAEK